MLSWFGPNVDLRQEPRSGFGRGLFRRRQRGHRLARVFFAPPQAASSTSSAAAAATLALFPRFFGSAFTSCPLMQTTP